MLDVSLLFHEVEDPRRSNATRHDLQEMLLIALLSVGTVQWRGMRGHGAL